MFRIDPEDLIICLGDYVWREVWNDVPRTCLFISTTLSTKWKLGQHENLNISDSFLLFFFKWSPCFWFQVITCGRNKQNGRERKRQKLWRWTPALIHTSVYVYFSEIHSVHKQKTNPWQQKLSLSRRREWTSIVPGNEVLVCPCFTFTGKTLNWDRSSFRQRAGERGREREINYSDANLRGMAWPDLRRA